LRPERAKQVDAQIAAVVPVVTTGLHCGDGDIVKASTDLASRPRRHDGAPLRLLRRSRTLSGIPCRPRRHDGAPLRRPADDDMGRQPLGSSPSSRRGSIAAPTLGAARCAMSTVVPVVTTGLHCGEYLRARSDWPPRVVPVVTTGLHCGLRRERHHTPVSRCRPRRHDGAPLRRPRPSRAGHRLGPSSPSSRRGSIAARQSTPWFLFPQRRRPRRHDGAPLRRGSEGA